MKKTGVYSWRVSVETRAALEREARREGASVAALLDRIAHEWLGKRRRAGGRAAAEQERLHAAAARAFGMIRGGDPRRAEEARETIRARLRRRHAR